MRYISLFVIFTILSNAFEVEMIDETVEAKKNSKAKDGKIIYKPIDKNIIEPIRKKVIEPMQKRIIYPIGTTPKNDNKEVKETISKKDDLNSSFATKDEFKTTIKKEEIKVDKFFDGLRETNKTKKITPVDLEK